MTCVAFERLDTPEVTTQITRNNAPKISCSTTSGCEVKEPTMSDPKTPNANKTDPIYPEKRSVVSIS
jgi:hypothetical protein